MKFEFLVLVSNDDSFCKNKKAFIEFLKVDSHISIEGQKLTYNKTSGPKPLITVNFKVETKNIPSNKERYFIIVLENTNEDLVDEFSEVSDKIKELTKRIKPGATVVNVLWDDIGRHYAYKSYPLINEVENIMRKLISKFMLINVGMDWLKEAIDLDLLKKIENFEEEDTYLNDLYKLDFINLSQVLFQKKRDITLEELDRVIIKTEFDDHDKEEIRKYIPKSNWEKYFSNLLSEGSQDLEAKWKLLYKLRNKVAHNRFLTREDFGKIKGLTVKVKEILITAMNKLDKIDLDEEERNQIINFYYSNNSYSFALSAITSVAEFYTKNGFKVMREATTKTGSRIDLIVKDSNQAIAIEIKTLSSIMGLSPSLLVSTIAKVERYLELENIALGEIILVLKNNIDKVLISNYLQQLYSIVHMIKIPARITIKLGIINEYNEFEIVG